MPPCGGRAVAQRLEQEAEARLGFGRVDAQRGEDLALQAGVADTDRAAAHLLAVPDQVVGEGAGAAGVGRVEVGGRRSEGVMQRVPAALVVRLHQRPVDDPEQGVAALGDEVELGREVESELGEHGVGDLGLVGDDEQQVALLGAEPLVERAQLLGGEELRRRRAPALALAEGPDQALGAELLGARDQPVESRARHLTLAGVDAPHRAALSRSPRRRP